MARLHRRHTPCGAVPWSCVQGFDRPAEGFWFWLEGLIDIFFYTDLVLNFFTAYEVRGS